MGSVTMRYWAAARSAAGVSDETHQAATLAEALTAAQASRDGDARFAAVLARSSYLVDGQPVGTRPHESVALADGAVVEVLPPFAGGAETAAGCVRG